MTDTQKLEYLIPMLKAGMKYISKNGHTLTSDFIPSNSFVFDCMNIDATATANGIEWPEDNKLQSPRTFTAEETNAYSVWKALEWHNYNNIHARYDSRSIDDEMFSIDSWLASKQQDEKLMLGDCEVIIEDEYLTIKDYQYDIEINVKDYRIEQLEKIIERIKRLQK